MRKLAKLILLICTISSANAEEVINSFDSIIIVNKNSSINVTETISVTSEGREIKRGIYRDLPTSYTFKDGRVIDAPIGIIEVLRNGTREDYHVVSQGRSIRIYFGNENRILSNGEHVYTFTYKASRQLRFFENHDELYWNVTGNAWLFPVIRASATISWPDNIDIQNIQTTAFTGHSGATEKSYDVVKKNNTIQFQTTKTLESRQGFTIATKWPKGLITEPAYTKTNYKYLYLSLAGLFSLLIYYLVSWFKVGRDPKADTSRPDLNIDNEYSPAAMRFINRMDYDQKTFTTAIISLAVKGFLVISESDDEFTLRKTGNEVLLSGDEKKLAWQLLGSKNEFTFKQEEHWSINRTLREHESYLRKNYGEKSKHPDNKHFSLNKKWSYPAWGISFITLIALFIHYALSGKEPFFFITFVATGLAIILLYFVINTTIKIWNAKGNIVIAGGSVLKLMIPFILIFIIYKIEPWFFLPLEHSQFWLKPEFQIILAIFMVNIVFSYWMRSPTLKGQKTLDRINNFKFYLSMRDKGYLDDANAPVATAEMYDRYLPYAMALDIESEWSDFFKDVFAPRIPTENSLDSDPNWYEGDRWNSSNTVRFSTSMCTAMNHSISRSSVNPTTYSNSSSGGSSDSGFSGGGSSGGGGGGGGGGGW